MGHIPAPDDNEDEAYERARQKEVDDVDELNRTLNRLPLRLRGAYGRIATIDDWKAGKDFQIITEHGHLGPYTSIRDLGAFKSHGYTKLEFYGRGHLIWTETL